MSIKDLIQDLTPLTDEELIEFKGGLKAFGELNLLARLSGEKSPLKSCPNCKGSIICIRSNWDPDLVENFDAGRWGDSKPVPPYWIECKSCTFIGARSPKADTKELAAKFWNEGFLESRVKND